MFKKNELNAYGTFLEKPSAGSLIVKILESFKYIWERDTRRR